MVADVRAAICRAKTATPHTNQLRSAPIRVEQGFAQWAQVMADVGDTM
jgi:hypothetical protein